MTEFNLHDYMKQQTGSSGKGHHRVADPQQATNRDYYWITSVSTGGKYIILGPYADENAAQQVGYSQLDQEFDVHALKTRDKNMASSQLKTLRLSQTHNIDEAIARSSHRSDAQLRGGY